MDSSASKLRLHHILEGIEKIEIFKANLSEENFLSDAKTQSAILYQFLIIGEAVRHIDIHVLEKYPFPWHIPKSFRNYIAHEYHKVKLERVFIACGDLEDLKETVKLILKNEFDIPKLKS
ncbi:MAG: DUF86 domain-containing protein [Pyrinomonadaceae bacterium]|nr:DUF86 domain-containing protein [Sphingobacteriaceae bacterium]